MTGEQAILFEQEIKEMKTKDLDFHAELLYKRRDEAIEKIRAVEKELTRRWEERG
jgi:hypothetical protein